MRALRPLDLCRGFLVVLLVPMFSCDHLAHQRAALSLTTITFCSASLLLFACCTMQCSCSICTCLSPAHPVQPSGPHCAKIVRKLAVYEIAEHICLLEVSVSYIGQRQYLGALATGPDNMAGVARYQCMYVSCWHATS